MCDEFHSSHIRITGAKPPITEFIPKATKFYAVQTHAGVNHNQGTVAGYKVNESAAMNVLLVEDDPSIVRAVELMLQASGIHMHATDLGEEVCDLNRHHDFDIILLDLNLPDIHGFQVLKALRLARSKTPVLVISATSDVEFRVDCLGRGADDYLTKPFGLDELLARIRAIVRRARGHAQSIIRTGCLAVDLDTKEVEADGHRVPLTAKEYAMLELLALRKGTAVSRDMFLNHLYGGLDEPDTKTIDVFMSRLRRKLHDACHGACPVQNIWGRGYVLRDPDQAMQAA